MIRVTLLTPVKAGGKKYPEGATETFEDELANEILRDGLAVVAPLEEDPEPPAEDGEKPTDERSDDGEPASDDAEPTQPVDPASLAEPAPVAQPVTTKKAARK